MNAKRVIAVLGPTASGKTDLAIQLAEKFGGEILSCDSVQVFSNLNIGSAKPSESELLRVPHHLINVFSPLHRPNVAEYKHLAEEAAQRLFEEEKTPILCGGTGMYFSALHRGIFEGPTRDPDFRKQLNEQIQRAGSAKLFERLLKIDPKTAEKISPSDHVRIIRALEVYHVTQIPISELQNENQKPDWNWLIFGLKWDRKALYERINERAERMVEEGLVEETSALIKEFGRNAYALGSIGYRQAAEYLSGKLSESEMIFEIQKATRHYAKRQMTWFRKTEGIIWTQPSQTDFIFEECRKFLSGGAL